MFSETNETIYEYEGGLYKIVPGPLVVGKDGEYVNIISIDEESSIKPKKVLKKQLTAFQESNGTPTNSAAQPVITTPQKSKKEKATTPPSQVKTSLGKGEPQPDLKIIDQLEEKFNGELTNTSKFEVKHEEKSNQFANPNLCFTEFTVQTKTLKGILVANRLCYFFREVGTADVTKLKFGISGELSLAGLLEFAFITFHYIVNDDIFVGVTKLKSRGIQQEKKLLIKVVNKFNGNYSADKITRNKTTSEDILDLATQMLIALDCMYLISFALDEVGDPIDKSFLDDCFNLIKKILLTKTTLDVSQCHTLRHLNILPRHVLITTSDFSAACNIQHAPVLTCKTFHISNAKALYTNSSETQFIMDNVAVYGYAWFIHRYKIPGSKGDKLDDFSFPLETEEKLLSILDLPEKNFKTHFYHLYWFIRNFYDETSLKDETTRELNFNFVSSDNMYSKRFIEMLGTDVPIDGKGTTKVYKLLELIGKHLNVTDFSLEKDRYMIYSKLFLNYCIDKGYLSYEILTLKSRGIRDHDFSGSPIRCFGVAEKMNTDIEKFLGTCGETPPTEEEIIEYLLSKETSDVITKYREYTLKKASEEKESLRPGPTKRPNDDKIFKTELETYETTYGEYYPIQKYIQKYIQLTNDKIQLLYYIICNQTDEEFEKFQYKQLDNNRAFVYVVFGEGDEGIKEVHIRNTSLLSLTEPLLNEGNMYAFSKNNGGRTIDQRWEMDSNKYAGTTDLFIKRGGSNLAIEGVLIVGTATEADAASCPIGFYTRKIHCPYDATLYLNGYECAKIYTGRSKQQSLRDTQEKFDTTIYVFAALYNAKEYTFTNANYKEYLGVLTEEINLNIVSILNGLGTLAVGTNAENIMKIRELTMLFIEKFLPIIEDYQTVKKTSAKGVYNNISQEIRTYLTSVNTRYEEIGKDDNVDGKSDTFLTKNDVGNILTAFANIFYSILCSNNYKNYKIITGSKSRVNLIYADTMDYGTTDEVINPETIKTLKEAKLDNEESRKGGGTYSNEDLDYAVYIFPNNLGNYEAFYNYLSIKAAQEEQEEIERAKKEEGEKSNDKIVEQAKESNDKIFGEAKKSNDKIFGEAKKSNDKIFGEAKESNDKIFGEVKKSNDKIEQAKKNALLLTDGNDDIEIVRINENDNSEMNKLSSKPSSRNSPVPIQRLGSRDGLSILKFGGKKTKKTKKHKKPKNKKYTKKNVKRQQARHNKTTKRKKTTKRRAKRTRRQRHHTNH